MITIEGVHILLTYACTYECDHCFVWGSPRQEGTLTLGQLDEILSQAQQLGTVSSIYFEGGEPFLYYPVLTRAVQQANELGFRVGLVSNAYWATEVADAVEWLRPFAGLLEDLSISSDLFHASEKLSQLARNAWEAAQQLEIPVGVISIARPEESETGAALGQLPLGESAVLFRGRAADSLASAAPQLPWQTFKECPCEDLRNPGRVHLDPLGHVHICQGISLGNVFETPLAEIVAAFDPDTHPVVGPLLEGGPAELVRRHDLPHDESYADACHLCYEARRALRSQHPEILTPDQAYGVPEE